MSHQRLYADDPALAPRVFTLLDEVFPGVADRHARAVQLGGAWQACSTPFVIEEEGRVVAHVGLVASPLWLGGRAVDVLNVHAVATAPTHRRRGLARALLTEALAHAETRSATQLLTTAEPEIYLPFGFRVVQEHWFSKPNPLPLGPSRLAPLDLTRKDHRAILFRALESRVPVSDRVGVRPERAIFAFNEVETPLFHAPALDLVLVLERNGGRLRLFDVVGPHIPALPDLLAEIGGPIYAIETYFSPDRLGAAFEPHPHQRADLATAPIDTLLMARGPFPEGEPFMLPRSGRT